MTPDVPNPELIGDAPPEAGGGALAIRRAAERVGVACRRSVGAVQGGARAVWARKWVRFVGPPAALLLLTFSLLVHHLYWNRGDLPALEPFVRFEPPTTGQVRDADGRVLIELAREYRRVLGYNEIPPVVRHAILAAEDKSFFAHEGIDYGAFPRVVWKTISHSVAGTRRVWERDSRLRPVVIFPQGGSTVTQQLVRGYFLPHMMALEDGHTPISQGWKARAAALVLGVPATNKLVRKLEEIRLALWIEDEMARRFGSRRKAKEEILARYASFIYLGNGRYGFAAASDYYFGRSLASFTDDDADKAALLAGITKSPRDYAPTANRARAQRRRDDILRLMARAGWLSEAATHEAVARPIRLFARSKLKTEAPAVVENVFFELKRLGDPRLGVEALVQGRIRVQATVEHDLQRIVNEALESGLLDYERRHPKARGVIQGSVVVLHNGDGRILAEAGGRQVFQDRYNSYSDFNRVTASRRQPGSVMKPIVYLTAFRKGYTLDTIVPDEPISVPMGLHEPVKWISNYDAKFKGPIPVRKALAESRNAVAIWLAREVGLKPLARTAHELGIRTPLQPYITTALGASEVNLLELANAYRTMASGVVAEPYVIERIVDSAGTVVHQPARVTRRLGIEPAALREIQEGLRGVIRLPTGTAHTLASRDFDIPVMGKTGTTSDFRDALFVGSTYGGAGITVAVRIGFDDNRPLGSRETGGRAALPVFREIVQRVYRDKLRSPIPQFPAEMEDRITEYLEWDREAPEDEGPVLAPAESVLVSAAPQTPAEDLPSIVVDRSHQAVEVSMVPAALVTRGKERREPPPPPPSGGTRRE